MKRDIFQKLVQWKKSEGRKPLLLNGARQVGKTYVLKEFGRTHFTKVHYINFEESVSAHQIFSQDLLPQSLIEQLGFYLNSPIDIKNDLVIFDEIQLCPQAMTSLKYFCETMSELALCAAGSLLGVHLNSGSYPVGKVDELHMYPMTFQEFLTGLEDHRALEALNKLKWDAALPEIVHDYLWQQLKVYFIVGGLPEIVSLYIRNNDGKVEVMQIIREKQKILISNYHADFAKHSGKINSMHISRVWRSIPEQLAKSQDGSASRYKFKDVIPGVSRYANFAGPIDWLDAAGLVIKVPICHSGELPLSAYTKENIFKMYGFDVGLLGALSGLSPAVIMNYDYGTYKGYFAENFVAQELKACGVELYSWSEGKAEVEFLFSVDTSVIPIEVKSGWVTHAKSIKVFQEKYASPCRVIFSGKNLKIDSDHKVHFYPLYLAGQFPLMNFD